MDVVEARCLSLANKNYIVVYSCTETIEEYVGIYIYEILKMIIVI